jgi:hypothetical protein
MKTRIKLLLASLSFMFIPAVQVGYAVAEEGSGSETTATETTTAEESTEDSSTTSAADKAKQLAERLAKRKTELKTKLAAAEEARIKNKCKASQGKLSSLEGRIKGIKTSRGKVYANLVERLTKLSAKIKAKGLDTTKLDTQIKELQTKIETFNTDLTAYQQAVADLAAMDCAADPTAFKAALEEARSKRQTLVTDAKAIKAYVEDTIKPTLKDLKKQLEETTETESESESSTEGATGGR